MRTRAGRRLTLFTLLIVAMMVALGIRTYDLAIVRSEGLAEAALSNNSRLAATVAPRGLIVDRTGHPLVGNQGALSLQIDKAALPEDDKARKKLLARVAAMTGTHAWRLRQQMIACGTKGAKAPPRCNEGHPAFPSIALTVKRKQVQQIMEEPERFPGIAVIEYGQRSYPDNVDVQMGHVLGHVGRVNEAEVEADPDLSPTALAGRSGLEEHYNKALSGKPGLRRSEVDSTGEVQFREVIEKEQTGATLVTSIDVGLQQAVENILRDRLEGQGKEGAAVVLDVKTGRVLAMASYPTYSPDIWAGGISKRDYNKLKRSGALLNQALQGTWAPGSTFKPVTTLAMARNGENLQGIYACPSGINVGGHTFSNFGGAGHGSLQLADAIRVSCNTVFYQAANRMWAQEGGLRVGKKEWGRIGKAAKDVGLGQYSGIDLAGETKGIVASPKAKYDLWKERKHAWCKAAEQGYPKLRRTDPGLAAKYTSIDRENCLEGKLWRQGDAMNAGVGQGMTAVTPLQMANAYATLLGDGHRRDPHVGTALVYPDGRVKKIKVPRSKQVVPRETTMFLRDAMGRVTQAGTAAGVFGDFPLNKWHVMGKTGTAQVPGQEDTSWFVSAAPKDDPQYATAVMVARGGQGGQTSAPLTKKIYEAIYGVGRKPVLPKDGPSYAIPDIKPLVKAKPLQRVKKQQQRAAKQRAAAKVEAKKLAKQRQRQLARAKEQQARAKRLQQRAAAVAERVESRLERNRKQSKAARRLARQQSALAKAARQQWRATKREAAATRAAAEAAREASIDPDAKKKAKEKARKKAQQRKQERRSAGSEPS
ncbi:MAG: penicillin-binding protein 2 [Actinobacteria bacterium]|nr:penicillin-binding protein 2 [Actinomycetota bacterium]